MTVLALPLCCRTGTHPAALPGASKSLSGRLRVGKEHTSRDRRFVGFTVDSAVLLVSWSRACLLCLRLLLLSLIGGALQRAS